MKNIGSWLALSCDSAPCLPEKSGKKKLFFAGCLAGFFVFLVLYGARSLDVTNDSWVLRGYVEADMTMEYAVWNAYRNEPWSWPLGKIISVDYPATSSSALAPPYFLTPILKLLNPILPETFQYFGWWALICHMLQGGAAALLIGVFTSHKLQIAAGTLLFLFTPTFLERSFRHSSLSCQFLLIFALYCYFDAVKSHNTNRLWMKLLLLCTAASLCVTYYYVMVLAVCGVLLLDLRRRIRKMRIGSYFLRCAAMMAMCTAVPFVLYYVLGVFLLAGSAGDPFGYYSMNVNQIYNPISYQGRNPASLDETLRWSRILPQFPLRDGMYIRAGGQYDGFNYLGIGILVAAVCILVGLIIKHRLRIFQMTKEFCKRYGFLLTLSVSCVLYAWSNIVYWGQQQLFHYSLPQVLLTLTSFFRASSRMFYIVTYLIFLSVVILVPRFFHRRKVGAAVLTLVLALQLFDISPALGWKRSYFQTQMEPYVSPYTGTAVEYALRHCDAVWLNTNQYVHYDLLVMAGKAGTLTNFQYGPRFLTETEEFNQQKINSWLRGELKAGEAILIYDDAYLLEQLTALYQDETYVKQVEDLYIILYKETVSPEDIPLFL